MKQTFEIKTTVRTEVGQKYEVTLNVLESFRDKYNESKTSDLTELLQKHKLSEYMHNTKGPAMTMIINENNSYNEYWLNGEMIQDKEIQKQINEGTYNEEA